MKILKITSALFLIILIFIAGLLLGKNLMNNQIPSSIDMIKQKVEPSPLLTPKTISSISIPINETDQKEKTSIVDNIPWYGYTHKATGFSFNYPSVYKGTKEPMSGGIDFISFTNNDGDKIDIYISDNPAEKTLNELVDDFDRNQEAGPLSIPKPIDEKYVSIAGERAIRRRWIESGTGDNIKGGEEVFFMHNGNFFEIIRFFFDTKRQNEFEDILNSIVFK